MWPLSTPEKIAKRELKQAEIDLLNAQKHVEAWEAEVAKLQKRIARLKEATKEI